MTRFRAVVELALAVAAVAGCASGVAGSGGLWVSSARMVTISETTYPRYGNALNTDR